MKTSSYLYLNGFRVHYLGWNREGDGKPVVLIHGLASNARIWELIAPYLVDRGLPVFAPDARGHGLTDKPDGDYGHEAITRDLAAFIETCHLEKPLLAGHSWGAGVVLDYAARFPAGPHAPSGIVLVDGGLIQMDQIPGSTWESMRDRLTPPRLEGTPLDQFVQRLRAWNDDWKPDEQTISIILGNFEIRPDETIAPRLTFERHMQIVRAMWEFQTYERYTHLRCPVLAIPARPPQPRSPRDQDYLTFKEIGAARLEQLKRDVRLHWMEDTIHDIPLQRPAELASLILEFVDSL